MFLHELDHLKGKSMMHWNISEGNIDVLPLEASANDDHVNLMSTVDFYRTKISSLKTHFSHMFDDNRRFEVKQDSASTQDWKHFEHSRKGEIIMNGDPESQAPSFEDAMITDTIRAIRRDNRTKAKK